MKEREGMTRDEEIAFWIDKYMPHEPGCSSATVETEDCGSCDCNRLENLEKAMKNDTDKHNK